MLFAKTLRMLLIAILATQGGLAVGRHCNDRALSTVATSSEASPSRPLAPDECECPVCALRAMKLHSTPASLNSPDDELSVTSGLPLLDVAALIAAPTEFPTLCSVRSAPDLYELATLRL